MCYTPGVQKGHFLLTLYNHLDITKFQSKQSSFYINSLKDPESENQRYRQNSAEKEDLTDQFSVKIIVFGKSGNSLML